MDTLSHALYGKGLFGYKKYRWYSFFFGILPDIFSFGIYFIYLIVFSEFEFGRPSRRNFLTGYMIYMIFLIVW